MQRIQAPMYKNVEFCVSCEKKDNRCVFIFSSIFFSLPQGESCRISDCRLVEGLFYPELKVLVPFLSDQKY